MAAPAPWLAGHSCPPLSHLLVFFLGLGQHIGSSLCLAVMEQEFLGGWRQGELIRLLFSLPLLADRLLLIRGHLN